MHISEGVLHAPALVAGWAISAPVCTWALFKVKPEEIPKVALLSALFFVGSFIHLPFGPTSFHLLLSGVIGLIGGFSAFLAIAVALFFQALLFGFGGLLVLGMNIFIIATPAVCVGIYLRRHIVGIKTYELFLGGAIPTLLSLTLLGVVLLLNQTDLQNTVTMLIGLISEYMPDGAGSYLAGLRDHLTRFDSSLLALLAIVLLNIPLIVLEGIICVALVRFLMKFAPQVLRT